MQRRDVFRQAPVEFPEHPLFSVRPADRVFLQREVMQETRHDPVRIEAELGQPFVEVEQVAVFVTLKQRPQFGAEDFLWLERDDFGFRLMPVACDLERVRFQAM
jgi:hypothetical protein